MNLGKIKYVILLVGIALITLIGVQLYWANNAYTLSETQFNQKITRALSTTVAEANDYLTCFESFSKAYIKPHEGFYMIKQLWDENKQFVKPETKMPDTVTMYYAHPSKNYRYDYNNLMFSGPVTAEILIKFRYHFKDSASFSAESKQINEKISSSNFKEIIAGNIPAYQQYDTLLIDSLLRKHFKEENIYNKFVFAFIRSDIDSVAYISEKNNEKKILESKLQVPFAADNYFSKPYKIAVYFPDKSKMVLSSLWMTLLTSVFIILILVFAFWYFLKIIFRQKKLSEMKNDFINNMTHEFNTPVSNISLAAETLENHTEITANEKLKKLASIIQKESDHLSENIFRILDVATIERGKVNLRLEETDVHQVISSVISAFEIKIKKQNAEIKTVFDKRLTRIQVDERHFVNALYNLLDNALKYCKNDPVIIIETQSLKHGVVIKVSDNGIGMHKEEIKYIFDKFYRVQNGKIHDVKGFGLGLNYVQSVIQAHGGNIKVESEASHGTKFELFIPQ